MFCGGTGYSKPPLHSVLYSNCRRNSNGLASRLARLSPDFWATRFPGCAFVPLLEALMFLTDKSSTNTMAWFLLMWFEDLYTKSFLLSGLAPSLGSMETHNRLRAAAMRPAEWLSAQRLYFQRSRHENEWPKLRQYPLMRPRWQNQCFGLCKTVKFQRR